MQTTRGAQIVLGDKRAIFLVLSILLCLLIGPTSLVSASTYVLQAILPLSSGSNEAQYAQWKDAIKLATSEVSTSWAPSDSLQVDFLDYGGNIKTLQNLGAAAMINSTVIAVLTDEQGGRALSTFASSFKVRTPQLTPSSLVHDAKEDCEPALAFGHIFRLGRTSFGA
jgi:hypothetical protein